MVDIIAFADYLYRMLLPIIAGQYVWNCAPAGQFHAILFTRSRNRFTVD
jgi:hypothetical protein